MGQESLQERFAPSGVCFGCGPANQHGLKVRSFPEGGMVVANWTPRPYHHAFGEFLNGGIISTVLDCHSCWAGAYSLMIEAGAKTPPATVTSSIVVEFLKPTPIGPLFVEARLIEIAGRRVVIGSTLKAHEDVTATLRGTFVAVGPNHPAARRWAEKGEHPVG
jgi:acyl-coenzyme A thioesterase PaaI-like protein